MNFSFRLEHPVWRFLENYVYRMPEPPPRKRTKPMQVICVGFPRSGTESLQEALMILGYDYTYHGWDIPFETPSRMRGWVRLCRKKWHSTDGDYQISAAEFDELIGHSVAVTDAAGSCFAADLIQAYPDAKVIMNMRKDMDAWHRSIEKNFLMVNDSWFLYLICWFNTEMFWMWHVFSRFMWRNLFRCTNANLRSGMGALGKWVYREHNNMVRGLLYSRNEMDRLLEWHPEDGWEPLCKFLDKPIPAEKFPQVNGSAAFQGRIDATVKSRLIRASINVVLLFSFIGSLVVALFWRPAILRKAGWS